MNTCTFRQDGDPLGKRFVRTCAINTCTFRQDGDPDCEQHTLQFFFVRPVVNFVVCPINGEAFVYGENPNTAEFHC